MSEQDDAAPMIITPIRLEYDYTPGTAASKFLRHIEKGSYVGQRCPKCTKVYVPPRGSCPTCGVATDEEVPLAERGGALGQQGCAQRWPGPREPRPAQLPALIPCPAGRGCADFAGERHRHCGQVGVRDVAALIRVTKQPRLLDEHAGPLHAPKLVDEVGDVQMERRAIGRELRDLRERGRPLHDVVSLPAKMSSRRYTTRGGMRASG